MNYFLSFSALFQLTAGRNSTIAGLCLSNFCNDATPRETRCKLCFNGLTSAVHKHYMTNSLSLPSFQSRRNTVTKLLKKVSRTPIPGGWEVEEYGVRESSRAETVPNDLFLDNVFKNKVYDWRKQAMITSFHCRRELQNTCKDVYIPVAVAVTGYRE